MSRLKSTIQWFDPYGQPTTFHKILLAAHGAAVGVQASMVEGQGLDCGFAWVTVDGNHPLARYCRNVVKTMGEKTTHGFYGSKGYPRGWQWWEPGHHPGQSIGIHEAGARAFRDVLATYNIVGTVGSRYD